MKAFLFLSALIGAVVGASVSLSARADEIDDLIKKGKLTLEPLDPNALPSGDTSDAEREFAPPPPLPPLPPEVAQALSPPPPRPGQHLSPFDTARPFECSSFKLDAQ